MIKLKDVAKHAGVSISTVSRVLGNKQVVSEETREIVLQSARALDYRPNALAKSLKMGKSFSIALMIPSIQNQIFPDVVRGVEDTARKSGYMVVLCNTDEDILIEKEYISKMNTSWVDGFIVTSMSKDNRHFKELRASGVPVVLANRFEDQSIDAVIIDNYQAAYDGTKFLIDRGHKRIAFAMGRPELSIYQLRYDGYRGALSDAGIPFEEDLVMHERSNQDSFYYLTKELLDKTEMPDAIFASSDPKALIILRALHDLKVRIPEDISVLGFDNIENSALVEPPLTTISQPLYEIGALAAQKLIKQVEYKEQHGKLSDPIIDIMPTQLIFRKSVK